MMAPTTRRLAAALHAVMAAGPPLPALAPLASVSTLRTLSYPSLHRSAATSPRRSASTGAADGGSAAGQAGGGPLAGVRVLDLGQVIAGNYAGALLGYFGAEVIKVRRIPSL